MTDPIWVGPGSQNDTVDAGLLVMAAPVIEFVNAGGNRTQELRVGKWENAFALIDPLPESSPKVTLKDNFIDLDPDRFRVRVNDPAANADPNAIDEITITLKTTREMSEDARKPIVITLKETGNNTGVFESATLLFVSVRADDDYKVDGIANNDKDDRTHLANLGDVVTASYGTEAAEAKVPVLKVVKLNINTMRNTVGGAPATTANVVNNMVRLANEIYAALGIRLQATLNAPADPPEGVDFTDPNFFLAGLFNADGSFRALPNEAESLLNAANLRTAARNDVELYVVNRVTGFVLGENGLRDFAGFTYRPANVQPAQANSIIIGRNPFPLDVLPFTLAHEITHLLLDRGDHIDTQTDPWHFVNIMVNGKLAYTPITRWSNYLPLDDLRKLKH